MSILLKAASRLIMQIMLLLSILFVFRGHNYPGGGFIGALMASAAIALYGFSFPKNLLRLRTACHYLLALGLLFLCVSLALPSLIQQPLLSAIWWQFTLLGQNIKFGTPLIFDFGIYFLITGSLSLLMIYLKGCQQ
jgi:multicomponent Na+:H+ antiporter subunit B